MHRSVTRSCFASFARALLIAVVTAALAVPAAAVTLPDSAATITIAPPTKLANGDAVLGLVPATQRLHIVVSLKLRNQGQLNAFIAQATDQRTAIAQRRMAPGAFLANNAPTAAQAVQVADFLRKAGFTKVEVAPNRLLVSAYGDPAVVQSAFATSLRQVHTARGETGYANVAAVRIPAAISGLVQAVLGLQTVRHPRTFARQASPYVQGGHNPVNLPHIYGGDSLPVASDVTVGIITAGDMTQPIADLNTFIANNGLPPVNIEVVTPGNGSTNTDGTVEWNLDSQSIVGMAGDLDTLVFYAADSMSYADLAMAMNAAVTDTTNAPRVVNMSFGACESANSPANQAEATIFQAAISAGITFAASSGDSGSFCDKGKTTFGVSDPASSPYVVAVGGTTLDTTSGGDYQSESAWSGGGGGVSTFQPKPAWQTMVSGNYRGLPDIAFDADPSTGVALIVNGSSRCCTGGTSLSAPIFVGAWARLLQSHPELTFAAPYLYTKLTALDYNDVTTGSNGVYSAGPGYDHTTGLGSFKLAQVNADIGAPGPPSISVSFAPGQIAVDATSTLTITLSNASQPDDAAVLQSDFIDVFPAGLQVATIPNAATTCSGTVQASAGNGAVTLRSGGSIPASAACTITVDVASVGTGTFVNTVASGALHTSVGDNVAAASATLVVGNGLNAPLASVAPGRLDFALAAGSQTTQNLTLSNTGGGTLSYSFAEAAATNLAGPVLHDALNFQWDDGSIERAGSLTNTNGTTEYEGIWLNHFSVVGPLQLNSVSIFWPKQGSRTLVGKTATLAIYYDADGDGNPDNAVRLGGDISAPINVEDSFQNYSVNVVVPGAGDLYIGFADTWAGGGYAPALSPVAEDLDNPVGQALLLYKGDGSTPDLDDLSQQDQMAALPFNLMIRASGTSVYTSANCTSPSAIAWLSETPTSGSVAGGHSQNLAVTADATGMSDGDYHALLCATSNDSAHSLIAVPVNLTVGSGSTANVPPVANFSVVTNGLRVSFTDTSSDSDGSISAWSWDFGDGSALSTDENPSHTYTAPGSYTVTLTAGDDDAATGSTSWQVSVHLLAPTLATSFTPGTVAAGDPSTVAIIFSNPNPVAATLTADFSDDLPAGLTAVPGSVATTCSGNPPTQTATNFTLANATVIPADGSCAMSGQVTAADSRSYINTLAAGALVTDAGENAGPASATLNVTLPPAPVASVNPNALAFTVIAGGSDTSTLHISNPGEAALTWSIAAAAPQIRLNVVRDQKAGTSAATGNWQNASLSTIDVHSLYRAPPTTHGVPAGRFAFQADYGIYDSTIGFATDGVEKAAIYLNRFTPQVGSAPFTIDTISILWPRPDSGDTALLGRQARLLAYYDADSDGDPGNALLLGQSLVTINTLDAFQTYRVSFDVPGHGDIYVGFEDAWAENGWSPRLYPAAWDTQSNDFGSGYLYAMRDGSPPSLSNLANNDLNGTLDALNIGGNLPIRATGTSQGGPTANCVNPSLVPWLTESATNGTLAPAANSDVIIGVDASGMTPGNYTALLCVTSNDPLKPITEVPVGMTVLACVNNQPADTIFADDFDSTVAGCAGLPPPTIISGNISQVVINNFQGLAINLSAGSWGVYGNSSGDDINLYDNGGGLMVYWYGDVSPESVGGVVNASFGTAVLQAGDSVGPGVAFSSAVAQMTHWLPGADGYIGIAFHNETTGELNYGYIHLTTAAPLGFPAQVLDYAYNADGGPITIPAATP